MRLLSLKMHKLEATLRISRINRRLAVAKDSSRVGAYGAPGGEENSVPKAWKEEGADTN